MLQTVVEDSHHKIILTEHEGTTTAVQICVNSMCWREKGKIKLRLALHWGTVADSIRPCLHVDSLAAGADVSQKTEKDHAKGGLQRDK